MNQLGNTLYLHNLVKKNIAENYSEKQKVGVCAL